MTTKEEYKTQEEKLLDEASNPAAKLNAKAQKLKEIYESLLDDTDLPVNKDKVSKIKQKIADGQMDIIGSKEQVSQASSKLANKLVDKGLIEVVNLEQEKQEEDKS